MHMMNEKLCRYADDIHIFSFFEPLRMDMCVTSALIVNKSSAILGPEFRTERVQYMNSNHRDICKFDGPKDLNHPTIRNSLSTAIEILLKDTIIDSAAAAKAQPATLQSYLGQKGRPEGDHHKVGGSYHWIEHRDGFHDWFGYAAAHFSQHVHFTSP